MPTAKVNEDLLEQAALQWFKEQGYTHIHGSTIAPGEPAAERESFEEVVLSGRIRDALARINPTLSTEVIDEAHKQLMRMDAPTCLINNRTFHRYVTDGISVSYSKNGDERVEPVKIIDFEKPENNDWLVVNQFAIIAKPYHRRPDIIVFLNGLPLVVFELKNMVGAPTVADAYRQLQTYKAQIPKLFNYNELMVVSDGNATTLGTLTADESRFMPWKYIESEKLISGGKLSIQVVIEGVFEKRRFLDLIRYFVVYEDNYGGEVIKKIAGYHQFHAVNRALAETVRATGANGDRRIGVVWHTQGSGKSLTMAFYAGRVVQSAAMENPTVLVITDRNDLDDQLAGTFSRCHEILRQNPTQAENRDDLKEKLKVASGGIIFTTVQKFFPDEKGMKHPLLSDRRNIVVIADEAHRSQYSFGARVVDVKGASGQVEGKEITYGFAQHMRDALPNASFIGFTGTPIELSDKNTRAVFGEYISVYDIQRAVEDGATVRIYYESRLAKIALDEKERPKLDADFEEVTEGEEDLKKEKLKSRWAQLEALVGAPKRVKLIAEDIVRHWEGRKAAMKGKAMIVCMSRRICVDMYNAIVKIRPNWHSENDAEGSIKIIMTGSASDPAEYQPHVRSKQRREDMAKRFKKSADSLEIVIVRDMWLTGFDAPCAHTMYVDKPMKGHGLMQAIARVNRVFEDKKGGLVVDYLGLADSLKSALANYTDSGGEGKPTFDQDDAVAVMLEKYEICCGLFHGFDWTKFKSGSPAERLGIMPLAQEHILSQKDGAERLIQHVAELTNAMALAMPHDEAKKIVEDVAFFQAIKAVLTKPTTRQARTEEDMNRAIQQIISRALVSDEVIDVFRAAGLKKPDVSILSDEFLMEIQGMKHKNLAIELLRRLLNDEIKTRGQRNVVESRSFSKMLEDAIQKYKNRAIETVQVIEELIKLAKELRDAHARGEQLGLTEDEMAFYDALEVSDSAVKIMGDKVLSEIARELVKSIKANVSIDWTVRENVRAKLRTVVKRILRQSGYPPDKQEKAVETVLEQVERLSEQWAVA
ncbi:type I restriction endonuclease subunit R [Turneriella parva]|uniref:Type I restriction enzyme endonuclease subunit n=1 Tax=Turneriella parva (strain ATCC BAA-1111 / DSM 21527 / NCTC 11395 / H) TaxID=869212 RepID=I4B7Q9_TURPD|nr:type I restriction endonuclease subunit R [Turneriella parva]AFM13316.1 type I site-specific deoxyribonuclease, HsdR family [Turneriella parva DSM 21527]